MINLRPSEALDALGFASPPRVRPSGGVNDALPWTPPLGVRSSQLTAAQIRTYQGTLRALGILTAPASGTLDAATRAAVQEFQGWWNSGASNIEATNRARQLVTQGRNRLGALTIDGDLGPRTQQALSLLWRWPLEPWAASTNTAAPSTTRATSTSAVSTGQQASEAARDAIAANHAAQVAAGHSYLDGLTAAGEWLGDVAFGATHDAPAVPPSVRVGTQPATQPTTQTTTRPSTTPATPAQTGGGQLAPVAPATSSAAPAGWSTGEKALVGGAVVAAVAAVVLASRKRTRRGRR